MPQKLWSKDRERDFLAVFDGYDECCVQIKRLESLKKEYLRQAVEIANEQSVDVGDVRLQLIERMGNVDYQKLCKDRKISPLVQEKYRKPSTSYWKLGHFEND